MKVMKTFAAVAVAAVFSASAFAQSFNIDMNAGTGAGAGAPANTFGAASGQVGNWHLINSFVINTPIALTGLDGAPTGATISSNASFTTGSFFSSTTNGLAAAPVDTQRLLADILDLGSSTIADRVFTFNGLANGVYDVYTYAMAPDSAAFVSRVNVNAPAGPADAGAQTVGGPYTGSFQQGVTHALHTGIVVGNGTLVVNARAATTFGSLAGIQLVLVPAPAALALLGVAGLAGGRRRRA